MSETGYQLTEKQAVLLCLLAEGEDATPKTTEIRHLVINVFLAWYRDQLGADNFQGAALRQRANQIYGPIADQFKADTFLDDFLP